MGINLQYTLVQMQKTLSTPLAKLQTNLQVIIPNRWISLGEAGYNISRICRNCAIQWEDTQQTHLYLFRDILWCLGEEDMKVYIRAHGSICNYIKIRIFTKHRISKLVQISRRIILCLLILITKRSETQNIATKLLISDTSIGPRRQDGHLVCSHPVLKWLAQIQAVHLSST